MRTREALVAAGVLLALTVSALSSNPDHCMVEILDPPVKIDGNEDSDIHIDFSVCCTRLVNDTKIFLQLVGFRTQFLNITCAQATENYTCEDIPEFDFGENGTLNELNFHKCPLEFVSIACVLRRLRIKKVLQLTVRFPPRGFTLSRDIADQLQGPQWIYLEDKVETNKVIFTKGTLTPLSALERLSLDHVAVKLEPGALACLRALTVLDLASTCQTEGDLPPGELARLPSLKELNFFENNITITHDTFQNLTSLEVLYLSDDSFYSITDLAVLTIGCPRLHELYVYSINLELLRPLETLQQLEKLDISQCKRNTSLELSLHALGALPRLEHVTITWCKVRTLPKDLFIGSKSLLSLNLHHNLLSTLPASLLANQSKLQDLDLSWNKLKTLPQEFFSSLGGLQRLNLKSNLLKELPDQFMERLPRIRVLDVGSNPLFCDSRLFQLALLVSESASNAALPRVEAQGADCSGPPALRGRHFADVALQELCVPGCSCIQKQNTLKMECTARLNSLPLQFSVIPLELKLQYAPTSLAWLPSNVQTLDLSNLNMTEVPADLNSSAIRDVDLSGNSLTRVPVELLAANVTAKLARNPLSCDCGHAPGIAQLHAYRALVEDYAAVACAGGVPVQQVDAQRLCRARWWWWLVGALLVLLGLAGVMLLRYPQYLRDNCNLQLCCLRHLMVNHYNGSGGDNEPRVGLI